MTPERYARVQDLFLQASGLSESQRKSLLDQQCGSDLELREEVESLLRFDSPKTLIASNDDTVAMVHSGTVVQRGGKSVSKKLHTIGQMTRHLGPTGHLAIGAFLTCILLTLIGLAGRHSIRLYQRSLQADALQEILDAKIAALELWFESEQDQIESWLRSEKLQRLACELLLASTQSDGDWVAVAQAEQQDELAGELKRLAGEEIDHAIWNRQGYLVADSRSSGQSIGSGPTPYGAGVLSVAFAGESKILLYDQEHLIAKRSNSQAFQPRLGVISPIRDEAGSVVGAILVHDADTRSHATRILNMVRLGPSAETYAFDKQAMMLSQSRFSEQLHDVGLLPTDAGTGYVHLRDPGGDLTRGFRPSEPLETRPLTKMARHATAGQDGFDVKGYRDYRGVSVVGAWRWLDEYDIGLATEIDVNDRMAGSWILELQSFLVFGLLAGCLGITLFSYYSIHRMRSQVGENRRLGNYTLDRKIGEGGMGDVYLARHHFLKRPMAIKLLKPGLVDRQSTARFEREAQLTSQLTHPNTVAVYDYGETPEGILFFVMEYVNGVSLAELVDWAGPLTPAHVVFLLKQICGSLNEAHWAGLIHRDLKPQNIMVCRLGGEVDVVKVLDFGLVKHTVAMESHALTSAGFLAGTPMYIAPERLLDPTSASPATDIYSLGAVLFFLLTGREVFEGSSIADIVFQAINNDPPRPSDFQDVPPQLDDLVVSCLSKSPDARPQSASAIIDQLNGFDSWTQKMSRQWWESRLRSDKNPPAEKKN